MTNSLFDYDDDASQYRAVDPWDQSSDFAPTPGDFGRTPCTSYSLSPTPDPRSRRTQSDCLAFLPYDDWERRERDDCDEETENHDLLRYTIAWKLKIDHSIEARETEQDLAVAPSEYWEKCLKQKIEKLVHTKKRNRRVRSEDTAVVVSVKNGNQGHLEKHYPATDIEWRPVERQLRKWSNLIRMGKTPQIALTFKYVRDDNTSKKTGDKRGSSATKRMFAERDAELMAEEGSANPSNWRHVYKLMRCSVSSCDNHEKWCWQDPRGRKHYFLRKPHLLKLTSILDNDGKLDSHEDVPEDIRQDLYSEAQQKLERRSTKVNNQLAAGGPYPININVLPAPALGESVIAQPWSGPALPNKKPRISGPRDVAVKEYCAWQELQVADETLKADWRKARDITLSNGLSLDLVEGDEEHAQFLRQQGVTKGTARHFVRDINEWIEQVRSDPSLEQNTQDPSDDSAY